MNTLGDESVLRLAPGCRLSEAGAAEDLLLIPEGALKLRGPARAIVELCNGQHAVRDIVGELARRYGAENAARIQTETIALLTRLRDRGALESI